MTTIHVICCNDSVEYAVIDDLNKAESRLIELKKAMLKRYNMDSDPDNKLYFHIHSVEGE